MHVHCSTTYNHYRIYFYVSTIFINYYNYTQGRPSAIVVSFSFFYWSLILCCVICFFCSCISPCISSWFSFLLYIAHTTLYRACYYNASCLVFYAYLQWLFTYLSIIFCNKIFFFSRIFPPFFFNSIRIFLRRMCCFICIHVFVLCLVVCLFFLVLFS